MITASPAVMAAQTTTTKDPKEKARVLQGRLLKGLDLILEAQTAGDPVKAASLQRLYDQLEEEYIAAKRLYSTRPEDLLRCPDCPNLGKPALYEIGDYLVVCSGGCSKVEKK